MTELAPGHNPDILTCLANLSADEVFTPPKLASAMLDLLPQDLFRRADTTGLAPMRQSGVFLREIARRLNEGLRDQMPDEQARVDHILTKQVFGLATSELTAAISRRSVYCSKKADGKFSIATKFTTFEGNIRLPRTQHRWNTNGRCEDCGANEFAYERGESFEAYAYPFIHGIDPRELFNVQFDVIIGNPPYQMNVGVQQDNYAIPLYHHFIEHAKKLAPRYLTMIVPSRWFTGGRGLDQFRTHMLTDRRLQRIVDYTDSRDCFPGVDVAGGIMYFLWHRDTEGECLYTNITMGSESTSSRRLDEFPVFPRYNQSLSIIRKVRDKLTSSMTSCVSAQTPFGLYSSFKGPPAPAPGMNEPIRVVTSKGVVFADSSQILRGSELIPKYKVCFSKATTEHGGQATKQGNRQVLSSIQILPPGTVCTQSYLLAGAFDTSDEAANAASYLRTRFVRFLILQAITSQDISREKFCFVPLESFSKKWTDQELFDKYKLTVEEVAFIESLIRPLEV